MTAPEAHAEPDGRAPWQRVPMPLVVVVGGLLLTLVVWGPLILRGGGTLLDPGDPVFEAWNLDWVQHAVTSDD